MIGITRTELTFEREPLRSPFGFKGGYLSELWQIAVTLGDQSGREGVGLGVQSPLWSDPRVFVGRPETASNVMMLALTARALDLARATPFDSPSDLLEALLPRVIAYGRDVTGVHDLRTTFALNALTPLDQAAWMLWSAVNGVDRFDRMIPRRFRHALSHRTRTVLSVPAIGYGTPIEQAVELVRAGHYVLKVKVGADPDGDGDQAKMLAADLRRMRDLHAALREVDAPGSPDGRSLYYLDANGRYESKNLIVRLLEGMGDALRRTILLEEPFPETLRTPVGDLPVRVVADESAHSDADVRERIDLGYGAIALKPIAKTISMSLRMLEAASERGVPCFCADLTVNPTMLEWNKAFAARLAPLPGMEVGLIETNGEQNYVNWERMRVSAPFHDAPCSRPIDGAFRFDDSYFENDGALFSEGTPHPRK